MNRTKHGKDIQKDIQPIFLNNLLKQAKIKENSMVKLEVLTNGICSPNGTSNPGDLLTFIDVLSIKNDSLK